MARIGIIGGSGLYKMDGLENPKWVKVGTPFGEPSDEYLVGGLLGHVLVFLPRHGRGHSITPTELNYTANIYGMKKLGVERIISVSAVGSFRDEIKPLDIVIPNQYVDRTNQARKTTFFGNGIVAHVGFAEPSCAELAAAVADSAKEAGATVHDGGTYLNMEGPAFSTKAESLLYKSWGMDVIGMTNMPEARCAREAEICYVTMAMVTDYDCWREAQETVTIDMIIQNLHKNAQTAKEILKNAVSKIPKQRKCHCSSALKDAIVTRPENIPAETKKKLELIIGKYIK
ncbi:MAG: S-methyl-5'-thioadenosine phosphorylase [Candidatus Omnitrophota bacterium]